MNSYAKLLVALASTLLFSLAAIWPLQPEISSSHISGARGTPASQQDEPKQKESKNQEDDKIQIPANDPDSIARRDFMRTKLMYAQNIFEGLTTGDFDAINTAVKEVQMVTEGERWVTIDNEVYRKLTEEFKVSTRRLKKAVETKNIEATALRYYEMSTRCIDCHQHIRKADYHL